MLKLDKTVIKKLETEAKKEILEQSYIIVKSKIIYKLREIENAEEIVRNLKREYEDLLIEISE